MDVRRGGPPRAGRPFPLRGRVALAGLVLAGTLLRAAPIAERPVSLDEALTWRTAAEPWRAFLTWSHHPDHPPLSFALVRISTALAGTDAEWALRLPSVVAGALSIPAAAAVGSAFSPVAGVALAALVAVEPELVEQARTARMYPLLALLLLLAVWATARIAAGEETDRFRWVGLGGILAAAIWTHGLGVALWLAVAATVPFARGARARLVAALALAACLAIPGLLAVLGGDFGERGRPAGIEEVVAHAAPVARSALGVLGVGVPGVLLSAAGFAGLAALARRSTPTAGLLVAISALTIGAVLVAAPGRPFGIERYLTPVRLTALAGLGALLAAGIEGRVRVFALTAVTGLSLIFAWQSLPRGLPAENRVGGVTRALAARREPQTPVVFRPAYLRHPGAYYGIRPAVEEPDTGRVWIVTQASGLLRPATHAALPGEVARRLPQILGRRGLEVDLDGIGRVLARERALAIGIDDGGAALLTPGGRILGVDSRPVPSAEHGVEGGGT